MFRYELLKIFRLRALRFALLILLGLNFYLLHTEYRNQYFFSPKNFSQAEQWQYFEWMQEEFMGDLRADKLREFMELYWRFELRDDSSLRDFLTAQNYPSTGDIGYDRRILVQRVYKPLLYAVEYEEYANLLVARAEASILRAHYGSSDLARDQNIVDSFSGRQLSSVYPNDRYLFEFSHEISAGILLLFLLLLTLTLLYEEKRTHMHCLLLSTPNYISVMRSKFILLLLLCFFVNALFYMQVHFTCRVLYQTASHATLPLYSLKPYLNTPLTMSISSYQYLYFLTRSFASIALVTLSAVLTMTSKSQIIAAARVSVLLLVLAALDYLGHFKRNILLIYLNPLTALRTESLYAQPDQVAIFNRSIWAYQLTWIWLLALIGIGSLASYLVLRKEIR